jgi:hypothetical protein
MAERIRAENESLRSAQNAPGNQYVQPDTKEQAGQSETQARPQNGPAPPASASPLEKLQWDYRLFEERRRTLSYVCDVPTAIEQRLFALAREIQNNLDSQ